MVFRKRCLSVSVANLKRVDLSSGEVASQRVATNRATPSSWVCIRTIPEEYLETECRVSGEVVQVGNFLLLQLLLGHPAPVGDPLDEHLRKRLMMAMIMAMMMMMMIMTILGNFHRTHPPPPQKKN